jgi:hypothetical protein
MKASRIIITGAAALALVAGGTAAGAIPFASSGSVYKGCIEGTARTMEHVYTRTNPPACPSGSFAASWPGQTTAGPSGLDLTLVQATSPADALSWDAPCPSSEPYLVSGGVAITAGPGVVVQSFPNVISGSNAWSATVNAPSTFTVYATCSK